MIQTIIIISLILFGISIAITFTRIIIGPSFPDRVLALDVIGVNLISAMTILALIYDLIGALIILLGAIISVASAIGMIRFPDIFSRAHAATKTTTLAVLITLFGTFFSLLFSQSYLSVRLLLGIGFVFITAPVSGHLVLRAAYRAGIPMSGYTAADELRDVVPPSKKTKK